MSTCESDAMQCRAHSRSMLFACVIETGFLVGIGSTEIALMTLTNLRATANTRLEVCWLISKEAPKLGVHKLHGCNLVSSSWLLSCRFASAGLAHHKD